MSPTSRVALRSVHSPFAAASMVAVAIAVVVAVVVFPQVSLEVGGAGAQLGLEDGRHGAGRPTVQQGPQRVSGPFDQIEVLQNQASVNTSNSNYKHPLVVLVSGDSKNRYYGVNHQSNGPLIELDGPPPFRGDKNDSRKHYFRIDHQDGDQTQVLLIRWMYKYDGKDSYVHKAIVLRPSSNNGDGASSANGGSSTSPPTKPRIEQYKLMRDRPTRLASNPAYSKYYFIGSDSFQGKLLLLELAEEDKEFLHPPLQDRPSIRETMMWGFFIHPPLPGARSGGGREQRSTKVLDVLATQETLGKLPEIADLQPMQDQLEEDGGGDEASPLPPSYGPRVVDVEVTTGIGEDEEVKNYVSLLLAWKSTRPTSLDHYNSAVIRQSENDEMVEKSEIHLVEGSDWMLGGKKGTEYYIVNRYKGGVHLEYRLADAYGVNIHPYLNKYVGVDASAEKPRMMDRYADTLHGPFEEVLATSAELLIRWQWKKQRCRANKKQKLASRKKGEDCEEEKTTIMCAIIHSQDPTQLIGVDATTCEHYEAQGWKVHDVKSDGAIADGTKKMLLVRWDLQSETPSSLQPSDTVTQFTSPPTPSSLTSSSSTIRSFGGGGKGKGKGKSRHSSNSISSGQISLVIVRLIGENPPNPNLSPDIPRDTTTASPSPTCPQQLVEHLFIYCDHDCEHIFAYTPSPENFSTELGNKTQNSVYSLENSFLGTLNSFFSRSRLHFTVDSFLTARANADNSAAMRRFHAVGPFLEYPKGPLARITLRPKNMVVLNFESLSLVQNNEGVDMRESRTRVAVTLLPSSGLMGSSRHSKPWIQLVHTNRRAKEIGAVGEWKVPKDVQGVFLEFDVPSGGSVLGKNANDGQTDKKEVWLVLRNQQFMAAGDVWMGRVVRLPSSVEGGKGGGYAVETEDGALFALYRRCFSLPPVYDDGQGEYTRQRVDGEDESLPFVPMENYPYLDELLPAISIARSPS